MPAPTISKLPTVNVPYPIFPALDSFVWSLPKFITFEPLILVCPSISNFVVGFVVPMPTLPPVKITLSEKEINIEICSACHPFYTGQDKVLDTAGRVDRFKKKVAAAGVKKVAKKKA